MLRTVSKPLAKTTHTELNGSMDRDGSRPNRQRSSIAVGRKTNKYCVNVNLSDQYSGMK